MRNWVKINDDLSRTYNTESQIKFKATLLKSGVSDYSDADIQMNYKNPKHWSSSNQK